MHTHNTPPVVGFDASYMDPLGHMMLGSEDYRHFTTVLQVTTDLKSAGGQRAGGG